MLDQIVAGNSVSLGLAGWVAYGPAVAAGLVALVLLALPNLRRTPTARRSDHVVVRVTDDVGITAYLPGLILGGIAAALAYYGSRPQVIVAADSLACRPWTRPIQMSEIRGVSVGETGQPARPAALLDISFAGEMRRGGIPTRIEEVVIAVLRGPSALATRTGTCPLGGLAIDGREAAYLIQVAWGRASLGGLPDAGASPAVEAFCANPPARMRANCAELVRRGAEQCRGVDGAAGLACRYQVAMGERFVAPPPGPRSAPAAPPAAPPTAAPAAPPGRPASPPAPPTATPSAPPTATPTGPTAPAGPGKPPAPPGGTPPGAPAAPSPGKPS